MVVLNQEGKIALRVRRDGRWRSLWVEELTYLTEQELADMPPPTSRAVRDQIEATNHWHYDAKDRLWRNDAPEPEDS